MNETHQKKLINDFAGGTTHEHLTTIVTTSRNYAVFRIAGHHYWSGNFCPWRYAGTEYVLIRKGEHGAARGRRWNGRLTKAVRAEIEKALRDVEGEGGEPT
jgi:N-acetylmuramoyl-L-alanine amidase CwlA